jgi:hypothetical protein
MLKVSKEHRYRKRISVRSRERGLSAIKRRLTIRVKEEVEQERNMAFDF